MKTVKYVLMVVLALCLAFATVGCFGNDSESQPKEESGYTTVLVGFDVQENIEVDENQLVTVQVPIVTDQDGNILEVLYEVTTKDGGYVTVTSGKFFATDVDGYEIRYVVIDAYGKTFEKKSSVTVNSVKNLEISVNYEVLVEVGQTVEIDVICVLDNPTYTYSVVNKETQENVAVSEDGEFVLNQKGWYAVTVVANEDTDNLSYSYEIYCRDAQTEGEIEVFGQDWAEIRLLQNYGTYNAQYTNTQLSGVKNRFGLDDEYIVLKTNGFTEYADLYINPRANENYYRQLADEGYTHVSFWIYSDCTIPHDVMLQLYPSKGLYTFDVGSVMPRKWVEIKVNLVETDLYYQSCFSSAVEYFKGQETPILQFDNTDGWNGPNGSYGYEENMTFYISDVYAVKESGVEIQEGANTEYKVGDNVSLSTLFTIPSEDEVSFVVTYRGEAIPVENDYEFTANGDYEVSVIPSKNQTCNARVILSVTDEVVANKQSEQIKREGDSLEIDLSILDVEFSIGEEVAIASGYTVSLDGENLEVDNGKVIVDKDGAYVVEYKLEYQKNSKNYLSYTEFVINVYSAENEFVISDNLHMFASSEYCGASNWDKQPNYEAGYYDVGGKQGDMLKISQIGEALLVPFSPVYTKEYYQGILDRIPDAKIVVEFYVTPVESDISARLYTDNYNGSSFAYDKWNVSVKSLADFIDDYDVIKKGYEEIKYLNDNDIVQTHSRNENDYLIWMTGAGHLNKVTVYVSEIYIVEEVEVENDGVWNDLSNALAVTTTVNPWTAAQATRNGKVSVEEITAIGGDATKDYTSVTLGSGFLCYGGYQIVPSNTIKDAWTSYEEKHIVFDWYYIVDGDTENLFNYNVSVYGKNAISYAQDTWHTSSIPMSDILADWDDVVAGTNNGGDSSPWTPWIRFKQTSATHEQQSGKVYIGNIRFADEPIEEEEPNPDNPSDPSVVWNDLSSTDALKTTANRWSQTIPAIPSGSELSAIGAVNGASYIRVDGDAGFFIYAGYKILPSGEKSVYEEYSGKYLVFDWYYTVSGSTDQYSVSVYGSGDAPFEQATWHSVTIAIDDLLAEWENLIDDSNPMSKGTAWIDFNWVSGVKDLAGVLYIGNIRISEEGGEGDDDPIPPENPSEGPSVVWNDLSQASAVTTTVNPWTAAQATRNGKVSVEEITAIGGDATKDYTSVTLGSGFLCYAGYQIVPTDTAKANWEEYADYYIVFDWYYIVDGDTDNAYNYNVSVYGNEATSYAQDVWHTTEISIGDLLTDWDDVVAGSNNGGDNSPWMPWIRFKQTSANHEIQSGKVYIGNIRIEKA